MDLPNASVTTLIFKKKISAVFADGTRKQNLAVDSVIGLTFGQTSVDIVVDPNLDEAAALYTLFRQRVSGHEQAKPDAADTRTFVFAEPTDTATDTAEQALPATEVIKTATTPIGAAPEFARRENPAQADFPAGRIKPGPVAPVGASEGTGRAIPGQTRSMILGSSDNAPAADKPAYIVLGPTEVYTDARLALRDILGRTKRDTLLSDHYHNKLTATFKAGTIDGHLKSLFRDFRKFGLRIGPKLIEYRDFALDTEWPTDSLYHAYASWFKDGILPTDVRTFEGSHASTRYFKFWALLTAAQMKPAEQRAAQQDADRT